MSVPNGVSQCVYLLSVNAVEIVQALQRNEAMANGLAELKHYFDGRKSIQVFCPFRLLGTSLNSRSVLREDISQ
jgi:hypothetical protein